MILVLNHVQRMNVSALLGAQNATVKEMRAYWRLQDTLELSADEKAELEYYEASNGTAGWNPEKSIAPREFTFSDADLQLITHAIDNFPQFTVGVRKWLEPLLAQLPNGNGHQ